MEMIQKLYEAVAALAQGHHSAHPFGSPRKVEARGALEAAA